MLFVNFGRLHMVPDTSGFHSLLFYAELTKGFQLKVYSKR